MKLQHGNPFRCMSWIPPTASTAYGKLLFESILMFFFISSSSPQFLFCCCWWLLLKSRDYRTKPMFYSPTDRERWIKKNMEFQWCCHGVHGTMTVNVNEISAGVWRGLCLFESTVHRPFWICAPNRQPTKNCEKLSSVPPVRTNFFLFLLLLSSRLLSGSKYTCTCNVKCLEKLRKYLLNYTMPMFVVRSSVVNHIFLAVRKRDAAACRVPRGQRFMLFFCDFFFAFFLSLILSSICWACVVADCCRFDGAFVCLAPRSLDICPTVGRCWNDYKAWNVHALCAGIPVGIANAWLS